MLIDRVKKLKEMLSASGPDNFMEHALALEYIKMGNDPEAKQLFENLLQRDPHYVGSYYHLGKLFERLQDVDHAKATYLKGMEEAKAANDQHSFNELQAALEDIEY